MSGMDSEGRIAGGCPCNLWSAWNCRYTRDVARLCRAPLADRPEIPPLDEIPRRRGKRSR